MRDEFIVVAGCEKCARQMLWDGERNERVICRDYTRYIVGRELYLLKVTYNLML